MITKKEVASSYGICTKTLTKRLKEIGINTRNRLTLRQLELIYEELGNPNKQDMLMQKNVSKCA